MRQLYKDGYSMNGIVNRMENLFFPFALYKISEYIFLLSQSNAFLNGMLNTCIEMFSLILL